MFKSTDGGKTFELVSARHGDHHGLWIDPNDPDRLINGSDGGAIVSVDGGKTLDEAEITSRPPSSITSRSTTSSPTTFTARSRTIPTSGSRAMTISARSTTRTGTIAGGGECGFMIADPRDPDIIYSDSENGINRFNRHTMQSETSPCGRSMRRDTGFGSRASLQLDVALMMSPHNPDTLYWGAERLFKTTDDGKSWTAISGDLTRNDKSKQGASGGPITKDITSVEYYDTIFAIAESPLEEGRSLGRHR
jgi:hypothetical protein